MNQHVTLEVPKCDFCMDTKTAYVLQACPCCSKQLNEKPVLVMTVGLPRSGKSTYARQTRCPVVNPDSIRLALHGQPFAGQAEPFVWAIARCMVRALFLAGHQRVVLDATNTTRKRRDDWKSRDWNRLYIQCGDADMKDECIRRAKQDFADDDRLEGLIGAIERMAEQWEPIADDELDPYPEAQA